MKVIFRKLLHVLTPKHTQKSHYIVIANKKLFLLIFIALTSRVTHSHISVALIKSNKKGNKIDKNLVFVFQSLFWFYYLPQVIW